MIECGLAGKIDDGRAHAEALLPVVQAGFVEPNPAVFKGVLHAQGRIATPDVRMPLANASAAAIDRVPRCRRPRVAVCSLGAMSATRRWFLIALCAWTLWVWITRIWIIAGQDQTMGFKVVHDVLAVISIAFGLVAGWIGVPGAASSRAPA